MPAGLQPCMVACMPKRKIIIEFYCTDEKVVKLRKFNLSYTILSYCFGNPKFEKQNWIDLIYLSIYLTV